MLRFASLLTLTFLAASLCGCKSLDQRTREEFSKQFTCPESSITVKERPDLNGDELVWGPPQTPPSEVAKDPERLALWNQQHAPRSSPLRTTFQAVGCDHDALYTCLRGNHGPMCSYHPRPSSRGPNAHGD